MTENQIIATSLSAAYLVLASSLAYGARRYGPAPAAFGSTLFAEFLSLIKPTDNINHDKMQLYC